MLEDKNEYNLTPNSNRYIGLALAITSTMAIGTSNYSHSKTGFSNSTTGTSFVITKKGLMDAEERHGFEGNGYTYLKSPIWWAGIAALIVGEVANFAAYAFAPAILITPLGALSVLIGAVLGSYFLKEVLGTLGTLGCSICLIGSFIIVLHAPPDKDIQTIDEILHYAIQPGFLTYCLIVLVFNTFMIYRIAPTYGKENPLVFLSICSTVGSVSVMSVKAFGIAVKLTIAGKNQFTHPSTYVFIILTGVCILIQMNYFNKALSQYPTSIVNPLYYVTFTTATLCASFILYGGFNTSDAVNTLSLLCGFLVIFLGVYLLNISRGDPEGYRRSRSIDQEGIATDPLSQISTRRSMQLRRSINHYRMSIDSSESSRGDRQGLIHAYDEENSTGFGLQNLQEESDNEESLEHSNRRTKSSANVNGENYVKNGRPKSDKIKKLPSR
ncbi:putative magnesium transporter NIPA4 [Golovinomyces cichoracearum]|uniref:Putative magnesium transporter NIPA4 n=1 Tax=Golovinomyces cichoracearum TaxID=62708 RepID=A0A420JAV1_9PEZI|nr:putative magnesium transporter NIPA4 [Golovinomyces cichoracearum]